MRRRPQQASIIEYILSFNIPTLAWIKSNVLPKSILIRVLLCFCLLFIITAFLLIQKDIHTHQEQYLDIDENDDSLLELETNINTNNNKLIITRDFLTQPMEDLPWGQTYSPLRVFCMVPTLYPKKWPNMKAIADTWGEYCDELYFIIDNDQGASAPEYLLSSTTNKKFYFLKLNLKFNQTTMGRNIWHKMWHAWQYIYTHKLNQFEWFIKIDDDTWFSASNFKGFAQYFNPDHAYYMGHTLLHEWQRRNIIFNAGACYALSRRTLARLKAAAIFESEAFLHDNERADDIVSRRIEWRDYCVDRRYAQEDPSMGICLKSIGIWPMNSLDNQFRQRFHIFRPSDLRFKIEKEDTWFWRWKHKQIGAMADCCAKRSIAFHAYKQIGDMNRLYQELHLEFNLNSGSGSGSDLGGFELPEYGYHHRLHPISSENESIFYFDAGSAPEHDQYYNNMHPPKGQRIYKDGQARYCHDCSSFQFK